jgi:hypothetical protein
MHDESADEIYSQNNEKLPIMSTSLHRPTSPFMSNRGEPGPDLERLSYNIDKELVLKNYKVE